MIKKKIFQKKLNFTKRNNITLDTNFKNELPKISIKLGGFISIKNGREIYSLILDTFSQTP